MTRTRMLSLALAWATVAACDGVERPGLLACDRERCSEACLDLAGPTCDVLDDRCQARIFTAAQCVRETAGDLPEVRVVTEEELRAELAAEAGSEGATPSEAGIADAGVDAGAAPERDDAFRRGLSLLGLYAPKPARDETDFVGGYYESESRRITLVSRGEAETSDASQVTLAHEFVHALQDQQSGLTEARRSSGTSTDASLALGCLVEGEARLYEELAWVLLQGLSVDLDYWAFDLEWGAKYARDAVAASDSAYNQLWLLRYQVGARFLLDAWVAGGNRAVRSLFDAPPSSTLYWMLGYEDSQTRSEPLTVGLSCVNAQAPKGFEERARDTLGAFSLYALLSQNLAADGPRPNRQAWELAKTWRQDSLTVFQNETGEVAISLRLRFSDSAMAKEIEALLEQHSGLELRIKRRGDELELLASSTGVIKGFDGTDPKQCPVESP